MGYAAIPCYYLKEEITNDERGKVCCVVPAVNTNITLFKCCFENPPEGKAPTNRIVALTSIYDSNGEIREPLRVNSCYASRKDAERIASEQNAPFSKVNKELCVAFQDAVLRGEQEEMGELMPPSNGIGSRGNCLSLKKEETAQRAS